MTPGREAARGHGEQVALPLSVPPFFFLKKLKTFKKLLGRVSGGSPGVCLGLWGAVGLEKLVDSMTCKLFPATKIDLDPGFSRLGAALHESGSSEVKKSTKNPG